MGSKLGAEVWYLFNSGFAVKTGGRFIVFDYYNPSRSKKTRGLDSGGINPAQLNNYDVTVLASHAHMDHYTPAILKWARDIQSIRYVLSHDIDPGNTAHVLRAYPNESYDIDGIKVQTLKSTDEGVAFTVQVDELTIYHAGDLNWWHWAGEPEEENRVMGEAYTAEIDKLRGKAFDIAFVPVDPRLGKEYLWGLDYFMKTVGAGIVFPMHFRNAYSVFDRLEGDPAAKAYRDRIMRITRRGQRFEV